MDLQVQVLTGARVSDRKQVLDEDKRRLRLYQDRYLADGDLHSDGPGRVRRFRWKNMGELKTCPGSGSWSC